MKGKCSAVRRQAGKLGLAVFFACALSFCVCAFAAEQPASPPKGIPPSTNPEIGPVGAQPGIKSPIEAMGYGDFKGVIHAHSYLSHDSNGSVSRIIQAAQTKGINFMLMTDHPADYSVIHGLRGMHGGILFMPGQEINLKSGGVVLGINLEKTVQSGSLRDVVDEVHRQGGLAILGHIEEHTDWSVDDWDAMELYNTHYDALLDGKIDKTMALIPQLEKNPDKVWQSILDRPVVYFKAWEEALKKRRASIVAANDSHENVIYAGVQLDSYERSYGLVSTHLFLMELTKEDIYREIRAGHGYICFDFLGDCRGFYFIATDGKNTAIMGDEYNLDPKTPSTIEISVPSEAKIKLFKDGELFKEESGGTLKVDLKEKGIYRVEAEKQRGKKYVQWIYSNSIYVR